LYELHAVTSIQIAIRLIRQAGCVSYVVAQWSVLQHCWRRRGTDEKHRLYSLHNKMLSSKSNQQMRQIQTAIEHKSFKVNNNYPKLPTLFNSELKN